MFDDICGYRMMSNTPRLHGRYKLDIFVEPNLIEVFVNDGEYVISNGVYGLKKELLISGGNKAELFRAMDPPIHR